MEENKIVPDNNIQASNVPQAQNIQPQPTQVQPMVQAQTVNPQNQPVQQPAFQAQPVQQPVFQTQPVQQPVISQVQPTVIKDSTTTDSSIQNQAYVGQPSQANPINQNPEPVNVAPNLNKEEIMEEALSRTNQYTPFEAPKTDTQEPHGKENNKKTMIFLIAIFVIMIAFILLLPVISKMFGWNQQMI